MKTKKYYIDKYEKVYNPRAVKASLEYSKKYGYDCGKNTTYNNEADAFKHTFASALVSMDTNNNKIGRQIAGELLKDYAGRWDSLSDHKKEEIIADRVWRHMQAGDLILDPSGRRTLKNNGKVTGHASDMTDEERERLERYASENELFAPENRVFYHNEMNPAQVPNGSPENNYVQEFVKQYLDNNKSLPSEDELKQRVQSGELIYVHNYERQDGTKVSGYYRSRPDR